MKHPLFGDEVYRPTECAALWGVSVTFVSELIKSGEMKAHKLGKRFFVPKSELLRIGQQARQYYEPSQTQQTLETPEPQEPTDNKHTAAEIRALRDMSKLHKDDFARLLNDPECGYDALMVAAKEQALMLKGVTMAKRPLR